MGATLIMYLGRLSNNFVTFVTYTDVTVSRQVVELSRKMT